MITRIIRLPPVLFLTFLAAGAMMQRARPVSLGFASTNVATASGSVLLVGALCIAGAGVLELRKHHTTVEPWQRPSALVTTSVFAFSRNPLYLALLLVLVAVGVMTDALWLVVAAALLWLTLDRLIVRAEERMLEQTFADDFAAYRRRVRRWA